MKHQVFNFRKLSIEKNILGLFLFVLTASCGPKPKYSFTGIGSGDAESLQVNFFHNYADQSPGSIIEPQLDYDFTNALQDAITSSTNLDLTNNNGDLIYEGEIVEYRVSPMSATANQTAGQNRLTMSVNVRFFNTTKEGSDFEKQFSFFFDFPATQLLESVKGEAHEVLFERITQEISNESLNDW